jgi:hypothetical protein
MTTEPRILLARDSGVAIRTAADVADAVGAAVGADGLILTEGELGPAFFDLRTGLAGEAMQKFVNYRVPVAIVVPTPAAHGERFVELAREHRTHPMVRILGTEDAARAWLQSR